MTVTRITQIGLLIAIIALVAAGLYPLLDPPQKAPKDEWLKPMPISDYIGAELGIVNYVDDELATVFIDKQWAGNAAVKSMRTGTCCVKLPTHWKPGMKMLISWASASMYTSKEEPPLAEREVDVLPYQPFHAGYVWVIFLPGREIRVQPSNFGPGSPNFLNGFPPPHLATAEQIQKLIRDTAPHTEARK